MSEARGHDEANGDGANRRRPLSLEQYVAGVCSGDRVVTARAITLIESSHAEHQALAQALLTELLPQTGGAIRLGLTGVPGAGKSTFIEALGTLLTGQGKRVAVLAVDPSSQVTGGSILGDKTRMPRLAADERAFIRPSPTAAALGGVARKTRESLLVCEAAGYDVVIVETVGVGQSETVVAEMTDFFLALMIPGAGDELQGIKRGLLELVDMIAINKADGENKKRAEKAAKEFRAALHYMQPHEEGWQPPVHTCSALTGEGVEPIWEVVTQRHAAMRASGRLKARRNEQALRWLRALIDDGLRDLLRGHADTQEALRRAEAQVRAGEAPATSAAGDVLIAFEQALRHGESTGENA
jgi:LAO/AO transport system kinase